MGEDKKLTIEEKIERVLSAFDFEETHRIMVGRNHVWRLDEGETGVPNQYEIIKTARRLLQELAEADIFLIGTGGFTAIKRRFDDGSVQFLLFYGISSSEQE